MKFQVFMYCHLLKLKDAHKYIKIWYDKFKIPFYCFLSGKVQKLSWEFMSEVFTANFLAKEMQFSLPQDHTVFLSLLVVKIMKWAWSH